MARFTSNRNPDLENIIRQALAVAQPAVETTWAMSLLKLAIWFALTSFLLGNEVHAQETEDCSYPEGRKIEDLATALKAHKAWLEAEGWNKPEVAVLETAI